MKQAPGTSVQRHANGTSSWTLPSDHRYTRALEPALTAATVTPVPVWHTGWPGIETTCFLQHDSAARYLDRREPPDRPDQREPPGLGPPPF